MMCFLSSLFLPMALTSITALSLSTQITERPLLRKFGKGINERVLNSKSGLNRCHHADSYQSAETIPCIDMQSTECSHGIHCNSNMDVSSQNEIRDAYTANNNMQDGVACEGIHGRSSGSGCSIIRLYGKDAASIRGLVDFADDFFDGVDDDERNTAINDCGVFRIGNNVHAGFDNDVNDEGKMQVLYTKLIPDQSGQDHPLLLPLEVGELVGSNSLDRAQSGIRTLVDIGSQITSAVLGMNSESTNKLLDDCKDVSSSREQHEMVHHNADKIGDAVSNSYQRIIRYLKPPSAAAAEEDAAFWPHVDSTFLTLIPMPEVAGLEVWCPSSKYSESDSLEKRGEWVRPIIPTGLDTNTSNDVNGGNKDCIHVVALAGEFLQLLSNGQVPTCIHRVIAPKPARNYKPRVSAPLFLRPRRDADAILDIENDLRSFGAEGLYFEMNLMEEIDLMRPWEYMDCMSPHN